MTRAAIPNHGTSRSIAGDLRLAQAVKARPYSAFGMVVATTDIRGCSSTVGHPAEPSTVP
jgi:hypothetical protein